MKKLLLPLALFITISVLSQGITTSKITSINTLERNSKKIFFFKQANNNNTSFLLKAMNESSKDFTKCKWITSLTHSELSLFVNKLDLLENGVDFDCSSFRINYRKNKVVINIHDTKCTSEHKTFYFQESCNRKLTFSLRADQISILIKDLQKSLEQEQLVVK
ncbi:MAG: hypothetical protein HN498_05100 [Flavobacteriales bacterium]|jgi:hypothetical protein|nr:hypothetical protein [Flavobacteriales bacterium]MBT6965551.1 hypothetical protein [Flavobacteriales bacterium]